MRIIFLDIDGPMIPNTMLLADKMASWHRQFPPTTIAVVNELCRLSKAKIVFNTAHNAPLMDVPDIEKAIVLGGLDPKHIHPTDPKTTYPSMNRFYAVKEWLDRHPEVTDYVGFDDIEYTEADWLIVIDPDAGLTIKHLNDALVRLGVEHKKVFFS